MCWRMFFLLSGVSRHSGQVLNTVGCEMFLKLTYSSVRDIGRQMVMRAANPESDWMHSETLGFNMQIQGKK